MTQKHLVNLTHEDKVRLYHILMRLLPPDGEDLHVLEDMLKMEHGWMNLGAGNIKERFQRHILTGSEDHILTLVALVPAAVAHVRQSKSYAPEHYIRSEVKKTTTALNAWLETTKSPARFTESGFEREGFGDTTPKAVKDLPKKDKLLEDIDGILKEQKIASLVFIDLDNFKAVNDTLGHPEGDRCLERVVEILSAVIVGKGRLYRYGTGDEFGVLLKNFAKEEALATAERLRREIDIRNPGGSIKVTASIGVASAEQSNLTNEQLLKLADEAVYKSKKAGKNCVSD